MENKKCQNCHSTFVIAPEDFEFYAKVAVPPPTFCPACRMQRRMAYRNERTLYKRNCDKCGKSMICGYPKQTAFPLYCTTCWWGDSWDPMNYGAEYDSSKPFLVQWKELQNRVPRPYLNNLAASAMLNSEYTNCAGELKNCYLVYGASRDEDCAYSHYTNDSKYCFDMLYCLKSEQCYDCLDIESCYNLKYSESCMNCRDAEFLFDCRNCSDCIGCTGLRNKQYHILNQAYSKEEYFAEKEKLQLHTRAGRTEFQKRFQEVYLSSPRKYYHGQMNSGFTGDYIAQTENTHESFYIKNARGCKFIFWCNNAKDVYDYMSWGDMEFSYECVSNGYGAYHCLFSDASWNSNKDLEYASLCFSSSSLFGCIGLSKKEFCILNKQYTEEEYKKLREQIIAEMNSNPYIDARGISYPYGEFPPIELSPFLYADTVAQEHFPLRKEEIISNGFRYAEAEKRVYTITLKTEDLPESIAEVGDQMLQDVIGCAHAGTCTDQCTEVFRITPQELEFYRTWNIPLPDRCYNCRHASRVAKRNPLKLWRRACMKPGCTNEFETAYSPDRPEIVYCESCYNAEVA